MAWIEYLQKHGTPKQEKPIQILEIPITNPADIQIIKSALDSYRLTWRKKIGDMRHGIHLMPQGVQGFRVDLFMQGDGNQTNFVFLQSCCREFFDGVFEKRNFRRIAQRRNSLASYL